VSASDDDVLRWYRCERKVPHPSERGAEIHSLDVWRNDPKHRDQANPPGVYRCDLCDYYHVGRWATTPLREMLKHARHEYERLAIAGGAP
jgi:hypothetical protein